MYTINALFLNGSFSVSFDIQVDTMITMHIIGHESETSECNLIMWLLSIST